MEIVHRARQQAPERRGTMVDLTGMTGTSISADQIATLARMPRHESSRLALVAPGASLYGQARMYQIVSGLSHGDESTAVFRALDEALVWLRGGATMTAGS